MASSSRPRVSSSSEEDVARGIGVQPYRSEPRRGVIAAMKKATLVRELRTFRSLDVSPSTVIGAVMGPNIHTSATCTSYRVQAASANG